MRLVADNLWAHVEGAPHELEWLRSYLTVESKGAEHSSAYQAGHWDGTVKLFDMRRARIATGLMRLVVGRAREKGFNVTVVDQRVKPPGEIQAGWGEWLRPYQREAVDKMLARGRGIVQMPTGAGKTECFSALAQAVPVRWLILVDTKDLMHQAAAKFAQRTGELAGVCGEGRWEPRRVTVATLQTLYKGVGDGGRIDALLNATQGLLGDEVQVMSADEWHKVAMATPNAWWRFGLSVGGESTVLIRCSTGHEHTTIADLWKQVGTSAQHGVAKVSGIQVRAFDGVRFTWRPLKAVMAHAPNPGSRMFEIVTFYGRKLTVTSDHSVFRIIKGTQKSHLPGQKRKRQTNGLRAKFVPVIECVKGDQVQCGDFLLLEDRVDCDLADASASTIDILPLIEKHRRYVLDGDCVLPFRGKRVNRCSRRIPRLDLAYIVGFFLGDGWINGNRVAFAVGTPQLEEWMLRTRALFKALGVTPRVRMMPGKSVEVRVGSVALIDILRSLGCDAPAQEKRLPGAIAWDGSSAEARELLLGLEESDGHRARGARNRERVYYATTSPLLAEDIVTFLRRFGVLGSVHVTSGVRLGGAINGRQILGKFDRYVVHWSPYQKTGGYRGSGRFPSHLVKGCFDGMPVKVRSIREIPPPPVVYDLEVEGAHNFVANGLLVHNSATALEREDETDYRAIECLGVLIHELPVQVLFDLGHLARPTIWMVEHRHERMTGEFRAIYEAGVVLSDARNALVTRLAAHRDLSPRPTLVFFKSLFHGRRLLKEITPFAASELVDGGSHTLSRNSARRRLAVGHTDVLLTSKIFNKGIDMPEVLSGVNAAGGASAIDALQKVGRLMRVVPGKTRVRYWDILDRGNFHLEDHARKRMAAYQGRGYEMRVISPGDVERVRHLPSEAA